MNLLIEWQRPIEIIVFLGFFPYLFSVLFPKTCQWPRSFCECRGRVLCVGIDGGFNAYFLSGIISAIWVGYKRNDVVLGAFVIIFILVIKFLAYLFLRFRVEISSAGIRFRTPFSSGFIAWTEIREINIVDPEKRLMFSTGRSKIAFSLSIFESETLSFDRRRVAGLIARFARKKLRNRTSILWCT